MKLPDKVVEGKEDQVSAGKLNRFRLDENGREIVDSRPMEPPVGYVKRESITDQIRRMIRQASIEAEQAGAESEEEANDFYMEDDPASALPPSQYEFDEDYELEQALSRTRKAASTEVAEQPERVGAAPERTVKKGVKPSPSPEPLGEESEEG